MFIHRAKFSVAVITLYSVRAHQAYHQPLFYLLVKMVSMHGYMVIWL